MAKSVVVICPYCGQQTRLVGGDVIYPHRSDLTERKFWLCEPCDAYVGTHENSKRHAPYGTPANRELRYWRWIVHDAFDPLWKKGSDRQLFRNRKQAYAWLAKQLGMPVGKCHIGEFNVEACQLAKQACDRLARP